MTHYSLCDIDLISFSYTKILFLIPWWRRWMLLYPFLVGKVNLKNGSEFESRTVTRFYFFFLIWLKLKLKLLSFFVPGLHWVTCNVFRDTASPVAWALSSTRWHFKPSDSWPALSVLWSTMKWMIVILWLFILYRHLLQMPTVVTVILYACKYWILKIYF